jgi:hypothetical protein
METKALGLSARAHEIIRRESLTRSLESDPPGNVSMGDIANSYAEEIQAKRKYKDLPELIGLKVNSNLFEGIEG